MKRGPTRTPFGDEGRAAVEAYLADVPDDQRDALQRLRETILAAVPEAVEGITYGMPGAKYRGKYLAAYGSFKSHCSFFPGGTALNYADELAGHKLLKGTIQFTPDDPLAAELVTRIVQDRKGVIDSGGR